MESQTKIVGAETIKNKIDYESLINTLSDAFEAYHNGNATMPAKNYVQVEDCDGDFRSMPAYIGSENLDAAGIKWVNVHPKNENLPTVMAVVVYNDPKTGFPLSIMNGTQITKLRTGAVAGLATDTFAPNEIETLGIVGAGAQSYEQVKATEAVRDFDRILVSDRNDDSVEDFRSQFESAYDIERTTPDEVALNSDVMSTVTPVESPIISCVKDDIHINAMGADAHSKQEFEESVVCRDDMKVYVDDMKQALHSGEVSQAYERKDISKNSIGTLGRAISNGVNTSKSPTMFDSTGLAIQDVATAHLVYERIDEEEYSLFPLV